MSCNIVPCLTLHHITIKLHCIALCAYVRRVSVRNIPMGESNSLQDYPGTFNGQKDSTTPQTLPLRLGSQPTRCKSWRLILSRCGHSRLPTTEWVRVVHQITGNCLDLFVSLSGSSNSITFNMHNNSNSIIVVNNIYIIIIMIYNNNYYYY